MKIEIVTTEQFTVVGIRATEQMNQLGLGIKRAYSELIARKGEIHNIKNSIATYFVTPPNYKGNPGPVDLYVCFEVEPMGNLPHGMVHLHILPHMYSKTQYKGPASKTEAAYDYTSQWLKDNGYTYNDVAFYYEKHDEKTIIENDDPANEVTHGKVEGATLTTDRFGKSKQAYAFSGFAIGHHALYGYTRYNKEYP